MKKPIKTYARIIPHSSPPANYYYIQEKEEDGRKYQFLVIEDESGIVWSRPKYRFRFVQVFDSGASQQSVFETVAQPIVEGSSIKYVTFQRRLLTLHYVSCAPLNESVLCGYNGTILAYGQTATGKTYSISGKVGAAGFVPRAFDFVLKTLSTRKDEEFSIWMTYMEVYNEVVYDLLCSIDNDAVRPIESADLVGNENEEIEARNLGKHRVRSMLEVNKLLEIGNANRMVAGTPFNKYSSRSHIIVTLHLVQRDPSSSKVTTSKLLLVDLAGSEQVKKNAISSQLFTEARLINLSLHYLEQVIIALADRNRTHVPYRNCIITSLLKDSLGGNSNTAMLATISLDPLNFKETVATCRFAHRVSLVRNRACCNTERSSVEEATLLRREVERLKSYINNQIKADRSLTLSEDKACRKFVYRHAQDEKVIREMPTDLSMAKYCLQLVRNTTEMRSNNKTKDYFKSMLHLIEKGIGLLNVLINAGSPQLIEDEPRGLEKICSAANFMGIDLPKVNPRTGLVYSEVEKKAFKEFIREGKISVMFPSYANLNTSYYQELEKEWNLWRAAKENMAALDKLLNFDGPTERYKNHKAASLEEIAQLEKKHKDYVRALELMKCKREKRQNIFLSIKERIADAFDSWWKEKCRQLEREKINNSPESNCNFTIGKINPNRSTLPSINRNFRTSKFLNEKETGELEHAPGLWNEVPHFGGWELPPRRSPLPNRNQNRFPKMKHFRLPRHLVNTTRSPKNTLYMSRSDGKSRTERWNGISAVDLIVSTSKLLARSGARLKPPGSGSSTDKIPVRESETMKTELHNCFGMETKSKENVARKEIMKRGNLEVLEEKVGQGERKTRAVEINKQVADFKEKLMLGLGRNLHWKKSRDKKSGCTWEREGLTRLSNYHRSLEKDKDEGEPQSIEYQVFKGKVKLTGDKEIDEEIMKFYVSNAQNIMFI